jgi:DNA-binding transcriptional MerR regulator
VRIGEVAQRSGVSVKTIRYYEDIGVLDPPQRTTSGYRDYDDNVLERLSFVRSAQTIGLKLGEIREIVAFHARGETPCAHVVALIDHRSAELSRRIAELERMKAELSRLARRARSLDPRDCNPSQVCHIIGPTR